MPPSKTVPPFALSNRAFYLHPFRSSTCRLRHGPHSPQAVQSLHSSPARKKRISSKYPAIPKTSSKPDKAQDVNARTFPIEAMGRYKPYSQSDRVELAKKYSPAQLAAIEAGEASISEHDLITQGKVRRDPLQFQYLDDFTRIEPTIDKKIEKLRGEGQDHETVEGYHSMITEENGEDTVFSRAASVEEQAEIEDVGGWVPAQPRGPIEREQMHQGPLKKLEFRRTAHQLAKAALKEYLGTPTVREAIEYCRNKDIEQFEKDQSQYDLYPSASSNESGESDGLQERVEPENGHEQVEPVQLDESDDTGHTIDLDQFPKLSGYDLPEGSDHPLQSTYFDSNILPDPRYGEILNRIQKHTPPPKHFGTPAIDTELREIFDPPMPDVAPDIPKIHDPNVRWQSLEDESAEADNIGTTGLEDEALAAYQRVAKSMGETVLSIRGYRVKTITTHRVVNQTRLGKISSIYVLCVAGNENGMVGIGEGKATEPGDARRMAHLNAIKNMVPILRYEDRTIYGEVSAKVGAAQVSLSARQPGFGLRTSQHIFEIAKCAGLVDLSARVTRSRNPMNVAKAVWQALRSQKHPDEIARGRGKKLVDVRKVYYSALV